MAKIDITKYAAMVANAASKVKISSTVFKDFIANVKGVVDGNYDLLDAVQNARNGLSSNALINGNFDVWQRGTSLTLASTVGSYLADRFISLNNTTGASSTASRVAIADLDGSVYGLQFVHAALPANQGRLNHLYTMGAADSYKLAGKKVTFSVKVKGVLAMNQVSVVARYNTTETQINGSSTLIANATNSVINNTTWTIVSLTFTCPNRATLTSSGVIGFQITASKTTSEASGDGFIIAQVQVNTSDQVLPFQPRSSQEELQLCRFYYYRHDNEGNNTRVGFGTGSGTTRTDIVINLPVKMRIVPTLVVSAQTDFELSDSAAATAVTSMTVVGIFTSTNTVALQVNTASGITQFRPYFLEFNGVGSKYIAFDAELL